MTKIALITDSHAGVRNDNPAFHKYQKRSFDWFFSEIDNRNIRHIIHLGDVYDKRRSINFLSNKRLREDFLEPISSRGIETHMICGNHDLYFKNTSEVNALEELVSNRYGTIHTYSMPTVISIDGLDIQLLPWITSSNYNESMDAIKNIKTEIAMGHLELSGFQMYKKDSPNYDGMDRNIFSKFDRVFSGHFHHRSSLSNITYLGAFAQYTWSDYNDPRGFNIFDTETRKLEFLKNPYEMFQVETYDDTISPGIMERIKEEGFGSKYRDCYLKLLVVKKENPYLFDLFFDALDKAGPLDIQIIENPNEITEDDEELDMDEQLDDTPTVIQKYIDSLTLPVESDRMKGFMLDVYKEALEIE